MPGRTVRAIKRWVSATIRPASRISSISISDFRMIIHPGSLRETVWPISLHRSVAGHPLDVAISDLRNTLAAELFYSYIHPSECPLSLQNHPYAGTALLGIYHKYLLPVED